MNTVPLQIEAELARLNVLRMVRAGDALWTECACAGCAVSLWDVPFLLCVELPVVRESKAALTDCPGLADADSAAIGGALRRCRQYCFVSIPTIGNQTIIH